MFTIEKYGYGSAARLFLAALAGLVIASCGSDKNDDGAMVVTSEPEPTSYEDVKRESRELAHTIAEYGEDQRDAAVREVESALADIDQRLAAFETQIEADWDDLSETAREEAREEIETLKAKRAAVAESYEELRSDSGAAWNDVKKGFSDAYADISAAFDEAEKEFDDS
jgi:chromosome segregation ATPase